MATDRDVQKFSFSNLSLSLKGDEPGWFLAPLILLGIVALFLLPVPAHVLDILLACNIVVSLALLLRALLVRDAKLLYAFPVLLLLTTLFRLSLNVTSTRLILLRGEQGTDIAGNVIQAFGQFVVGGDFVVGAIIFAMIATINFLVITRGAARVAEVSARFSLDSLPGRQLAVDTDLRNGVITSSDAARARLDLMNESQFYGSMDGAMRFVQGDAIATLIIVFINVVGGVFLGVSRGLQFSDSIRNFGVLAIGDGLVSILPALLISLTAGLVVTHASGTSTVGEQVTKLFADRRVFILPAILLFLIGLIPQFPFIPFFLLAVALIIFAQLLRPATKSGREILERLSRGSSPRQRRQLLEELNNSARLSAESLDPGNLSVITVTLSASGAQMLLVDGLNPGRNLISECELERARVLAQRGIPLPELQIEFSADLLPAEYRIAIRGSSARVGRIPPNKVFVSLSAIALSGFGVREVVEGRHPAQPRPGCWIASDEKVEQGLKELGAEISPPFRYIVLQIVGAAFEMVEELYGIDELKYQLQKIREQHPSLVTEVLDRGTLTVAELCSVLHRLIKERVNVRDLKLILEGIAQQAHTFGEGLERAELIDNVVELLRRTLARQIVGECLSASGTLRAFTLAGDVEEEFRSAAQLWESSALPPPVDPTLGRALRQSATRMFQPVIERGAGPVVLLVPADVRAAVSGFFRFHDFGSDWFVALSFEECGTWKTPETVGVLGV